MSKPQDWDLFLKHITKEYEINGKLREIFLVRFAYENWRKADKEIWELAEAASHETYKKQMTEIYSYFASTRPQGCPELDPSSKGPGKFQILREWFKELKYPEWQQKNTNISPQTSINNLYIERDRLEVDCYREIHKTGALIHIKAPEKMGKTSLIQSITTHASQTNYRSIYLNLQSAEANLFQRLDKFLRWFCANVSRELGLKPLLDEYWDEELFGSLVSCKTYWQSYLLANLETPLVVAIDNLDKIFDYPLICQDFLPMLRYWHEESNNLEIWQKLRLILATSSEAYLKLDANQSPFNVGKQIKLSGFNTEQIIAFARAYNLVIEYELAEKFRNLVGGHPYLIKLALEALSQGKIGTESFWEEAPTQSGIYGAHLLHHWDNLQKQPHLTQGLQTVLETPTGVELEPILAYKLESMGLVTLAGNRAQISCQLYQHYFGERLSTAS
jgi:hypothetical protein